MKTSERDSTRQIRPERPSRAYWRVTFGHPPRNIFGPETIPQLEEIIESLERDSAALCIEGVRS